MEHSAAFGGEAQHSGFDEPLQGLEGGTVEELQDGRGGGPLEMPAQELLDPRSLDGPLGDGEQHVPAVAAGMDFEPQQAVPELGPQIAAERLPGIGGGPGLGRRGAGETREDLQPLDQRPAARGEGHLGEVPPAVEDAVGEHLLAVEEGDHPVLEGVLGHQVEDADGARLVLAPGTGDALLQAGRVPGEVEVDHHVGRLEVEPHASGVGGEEEAAGGVLLEAADLVAPPRQRHGAGVPGEAGPHLLDRLAHQVEHPLPFGEDQDLGARLGEQPLQDLPQLGELGADPAVGIQDVGGVADHPHAGEPLLELLEFLGQQGTALGRVENLGDPPLVFGVAGDLLVFQRDEEVLVRAAGELPLDVLLAAAQQDGREPAVELAEVPVADGPAALVELVELAVEAEEGAEQGGIEKLHDRVDLVDAVLERRAGEDERVGAAQPFDGLGGAALPVLDALGLVEHDHVRGEPLLHGVAVEEDLLVVGEIEEGAFAVLGQALGAGTGDDPRRQAGETGDLLLPLPLEGGRADDEHAFDAAQAPEEPRRRRWPARSCRAPSRPREGPAR